jgi:nitroreductase
MDALEALKTRRSVRLYRPDPVPRSVLEDVVDCARLAATALNLQPWEFVVVTERPRLKALAAATDHGKFIANAPACVVVLCKEVKYFLEDGCAATQNLLVAARAHGLGSCWVAGEKKPYANEILRLVEAPPGFRLVSLVPLGYPAEAPAPPKRPPAEVLHWERF